METSREHNDVLQRLRARGIKLAIDDFGTGYSSLELSPALPRRSHQDRANFVADITTDPNDAVIVKAAIGLMHELNLDVIAEGVETAEQLALLQSWGCRAAQGYYFAKPLTTVEIAPLLRHGFIETRWMISIGSPLAPRNTRRSVIGCQFQSASTKPITDD